MSKQSQGSSLEGMHDTPSSQTIRPMGGLNRSMLAARKVMRPGATYMQYCSSELGVCQYSGSQLTTAKSSHDRPQSLITYN